MESSRRAPSYDLFKFIVAVLLLILFLLLNWRITPKAPARLPSPSTTPSQREGASPLRANPTAAPTSSQSVSLSAAAPMLSPTQTNDMVSNQTLLPSPSGEPNADAATQTPLASSASAHVPELTETPPVSSTSTAISVTPVASACDVAASRSRLQNGIRATILRRLNFRSSPGIQDNWLLTNIPGTKVEVVGGPECLPHVAGAYVWWQIKLPDGQVGWSAEASQFGSFYFMEPAQ